LDFHVTTQSSILDRVLLTGGAADIEWFREAMCERLDKPVGIFDPWERIEMRIELDRLMKHRLILALGLALFQD